MREVTVSEMLLRKRLKVSNCQKRCQHRPRLWHVELRMGPVGGLDLKVALSVARDRDKLKHIADLVNAFHVKLSFCGSKRQAKADRTRHASVKDETPAVLRVV